MEVHAKMNAQLENQAMEGNNVKHLVKSMIEKWQNPEKMLEKKEKSWQKTERQWLQEVYFSSKSAVQHSQMQWTKGKLTWNQSGKKYQAQEKIWSQMKNKLVITTEGILIIADLHEFQSEYKNRRMFWENRKPQRLQKPACFSGRKNLFTERAEEQSVKPCTIEVQTQTDPPPEVTQVTVEQFKGLQEENAQLRARQREWSEKEHDWFEKEDTYKTTEENICQQKKDIKEKYVVLFEEKEDWDLETTQLKKALEEKTRQVEELQLKEKEWMERELQLNECLEEYHEEQSAMVFQEFKEIISTLEQELKDCEEGENTCRDLETANSEAQEDLTKRVPAEPQNNTLKDGTNHKLETAAKNKKKKRKGLFWRLFGRFSTKKDRE